MKTTMSSKGQIVLPAELRQQDRIEAGQEFDDCPTKGYFVAISSESTDTL